MTTTPFLDVLAELYDEAVKEFLTCPTWRRLRRRRLMHTAQALGAICWTEKQARDADREFAQGFGVPIEHRCVCCGRLHEMRPPDSDPWEGRLDGYCDECATTRCDTTDSTCTFK